MRWRQWVGLLSLLAFGNCVNSGDDTTTKPQGSLGGVCFANSTCNAGLMCTLVGSSALCEIPDATVDAPVDQGAPDAGSDVSDAALCDVAPEIACGTDCGGTGCCPKVEMCQMPGVDGGAALCIGNDFWACQQNSDCTGAGEACCAVVNVSDTSACPPTYMVMGAPACSTTACGGGTNPQICTHSSQCPTTQPTCVGVSLDTFTVGFCM
jgi:hypothetical protein